MGTELVILLPIFGFLRRFQTHLSFDSCRIHQLTAHHPQIRQLKLRHTLLSSSRLPAQLDETKLALLRLKHMFSFGPNPCRDLFHLVNQCFSWIFLAQCAVFARTDGHVPCGVCFLRRPVCPRQGRPAIVYH